MGRDLATVAGFERVGGESQLQFSATDGLSGLRADSRGGYYHSYTAELDHVFLAGIASSKVNDTRYRQGGAMSPYDQRGHVERLDADFKKPLSAESTVIFGAGYVRQSTVFGVAGLWHNAFFRYALADFERAAGPLSWSVKVIQALGVSRSFNLSPLGGAQDGSFTAAPAEARYQWDIPDGR